MGFISKKGNTIMNTKSCASLILGATITALGSTSSVAGNALQSNHVLGYMDTKSGTFHSLPAAVADTTTTTTSGTIAVTFDVKLVSSFAKSSSLYCEALVEVSVIDDLTGASVSYEEEATGTVSLSGGTTATCLATIPYSWQLPATTGTGIITSLTGEYTVFVGTPLVTSGTAVAGVGRLSSSKFLSANSVPATGTTSKYTVNVTL